MSNQVGNALLRLNTTPSPPCLRQCSSLQDESLPLTCSLSQPARCLPACLLSALRLSSSPSSRPVPSSLSSSSPTSSPRSLPVLAAGLQTQPPDRELTWTLDTVPARLTRLFAQSRVDNSSSTITSAGADHVWNREGFNALTTDVGGGIPQSH